MRIVVLRRVLTGAVLLGALCAAAVSAPSSANASDPAPVASTGALRICTSCAETGGNLARYGYVVLNAWDAGMIPALKAANPGLEVLVYKNLSFTVDYSCSVGIDNPDLPAGVGYCDANSNHPDWFLKDTNGQRIRSSIFPNAWMMDVGNPAYQAKWLTNVATEARADGWDGVFADDTNAEMSWHLNGRTIARYPTNVDWQGATRSMLATVGPALTGQGTLFIPNLYDPWLPNFDALSLWKDWIQFTSGATQEYYSKWGYASSSWFTGGDWTFRQQFQIATEAAGKIFLGLTYAPHDDTRSMTWARANFLLNTSGTRSALLFQPGDPEASDPYSTAWTADVGTPSGARYQVGGAWRRDFTGGTVLVNPSTSPVTVPLGKDYLDASGATVSSVTLASATGAVLRSTAPAAPENPPPTPPPPPPPVTKITLTAQATSATTVKLTWTAPATAKVDLYHNDWWFAATQNDGSATRTLGKANTGTYRVCLTDGSLCSPAVAVR